MIPARFQVGVAGSFFTYTGKSYKIVLIIFMQKNSLKIYIHSVFLGIKTRGLWETVKMIFVALIDIAEDTFRNIYAHKFIDSKAVTLGKKESSVFANFYQPVRSMPFRRIFKRLKIPTDGTFVDIGAGTGKAMLLALDIGFKRTKGIELVQELVDIAQINMKNRHLSKNQFHCICQDALEYEFEEDDRVFFFNDPFSEEIFSIFIDKLRNFARAGDKQIIIIYKNNSFRKIESFNRLARENKYQSENIMGNFYEVIWLTH